jgi:predicted metal-dependent peptidase
MTTNADLQARAMLEEAARVIKKAKFSLILDNKVFFFSALMANLRQKLDMSHKTAATDGVHLWINPEWIIAMTGPQVVGLLLHEVMHCAFEHMNWAQVCKLDRRIHNMAADYYINLLLTQLGFQLPAGGLIDYKYAGMSTMEIYHELMQDPPPEDPDYQQDIVCIGGDAPGEESAGMTAAEIQEQQETVITNVVKAIQQTELAGHPGSIPGEVTERLDELLNPKLPWNALLQNHMSKHAKDDYHWGRPNKRYLPDFYMPVMQSDALNQILVGRDVSGSMLTEWLEEFMPEMVYIWDVLKPLSFRLMDFDTELQCDKSYTYGDEFDPYELTGRGGTDIGPFIDAIRKDSPEIAIIFTDGEFYMPDLSNLYTDLVWVIIGDPNFTVEYGTVIHFEADNDYTS